MLVTEWEACKEVMTLLDSGWEFACNMCKHLCWWVMSYNSCSLVCGGFLCILCMYSSEQVQRNRGENVFCWFLTVGTG